MFWRGVVGYLPMNIVQGVVGLFSIVVFTRLLSPADYGVYALAFSAMSLDRPYRRAKTDDEIAEQIRSGSGPQFDPDLVEPFLALLALHCHGHIENDAGFDTFEAWRRSTGTDDQEFANAS